MEPYSCERKELIEYLEGYIIEYDSYDTDTLQALSHAGTCIALLKTGLAFKVLQDDEYESAVDHLLFDGQEGYDEKVFWIVFSRDSKFLNDEHEMSYYFTIRNLEAVA